ncbi:hypothetical protein MMC28_008479 [Mycoblastus sanguinarius]|nr:hypothetical protein [Mycoblastus sanguinarius]
MDDNNRPIDRTDNIEKEDYKTGDLVNFVILESPPPNSLVYKFQRGWGLGIDPETEAMLSPMVPI